MVSRDRRDPLQKVRKQEIRFWQEIIYKSLIPTFGKCAIMTNTSQK